MFTGGVQPHDDTLRRASMEEKVDPVYTTVLALHSMGSIRCNHRRSCAFLSVPGIGASSSKLTPESKWECWAPQRMSFGEATFQQLIAFQSKSYLARGRDIEIEIAVPFHQFGKTFLHNLPKSPSKE